MLKTPEYMSFNNQVVPWENCKLHIWSDGPLRGLNVFDAIRGFYDPRHDVTRVIALDEHLNRLIDSAQAMGFPNVTDQSSLKKDIECLLVKLKIRSDIYIRPTIFIEKGGYEFEPSKITAHCFVVIFPIDSSKGNPRSLSAQVSTWKKIPSDSFPATIKCGASYGLTRLARVQALQAGFDESILVNNDDFVCETPGANVFVVFKNSVVTPPVYAGSLDGITRRKLIVLLKESLQLSVEERPISSASLGDADEIFICGTLAEVAAITRVNDTKIGSATPGKVTLNVAKHYFDICSGNKEGNFNWISTFDFNLGKFQHN